MIFTSMKPETTAEPGAERILRSKLFPGNDRSPLMPRSRLNQELEGIRSRPLTVVCAPGGFGKTRLLQQWHAQLARTQGIRTAWLSLDTTDNEPEVATASLVASIAIAVPAIAEFDQRTVTPESPYRQPTALLNALADTGEDLFVFVDNYDVVTHPAARDVWEYVVSHLPRSVHCVVACRSLPPWPLERLRLNDLARVLCPDELRFTLAETTEYLRQHSRADLDENQLVHLSKHARGWAAAIKLAAVAIDAAQDQQDHQQIDRILCGNNPLLAQYMEENIVAQLSESTRQFLISTAHLERLHANLCDFVCGTGDAAEHLRRLEQSNLIQRAGHDEPWYEYLPIFRTCLQHKLAQQSVVAVAALHRKSIDWFRMRNMPEEALTHALKIGDYAIASAIVEKHGREMMISGSISVLLSFYQDLPEHYISSKPYLLYTYLWALVITQRYREAQEQLQRMQTMLDAFSHSHEADGVMDLLPSREQIKVIEYRIRQAMDPGRTDLSFWQQHKNSLTSSDYRSLEQVELSLGWAYLRKEKFGEAYAAFMEAKRYAETGHVPVPVTIITAATHMADLRKIQGKLLEALELCNHAIEFAKRDELRCMPVAGVPFLLRSELYYELNQLGRAEADLLEATALFEHYSHSLYDVQAKLQLARIACLHGGADAALAVLERADASLSEHSREYLLEQIRAEQAKYYIHKSDLVTAGAILRQQKLPVDSRAPSPALKCRQREQRAYLALCRYLIASNRPEAASAWLMKLMHQAAASGKKLFCVELSALLALAHAREGNDNRALRSVREMLLLGESCGAVRRIVDEGKPIVALILKYSEKRRELDTRSDSEPSDAYVGRLLQAHAGVAVDRAVVCKANTRPAPDKEEDAVLTGREREVLVLIGEGLANRSISEQLILSEGTVKWHVKNIFNKLTVSSRTQALAKARSNGIIA